MSNPYTKVRIEIAPVVEEAIEEVLHLAQHESGWSPEALLFLDAFTKSSGTDFRPSMVKVAAMALAAVHLHDKQEKDLAEALGLDYEPPRRSVVPVDPGPRRNAVPVRTLTPEQEAEIQRFQSRPTPPVRIETPRPPSVQNPLGSFDLVDE